MKKIVINSCFGGFSLSEKAVLRYAELKSIKLYLRNYKNLFMQYFTVPVEEYDRLHEKDELIGNYKKSNAVCFNNRDIARDDPILIQVIEELHNEANGSAADLKIVEIPDDIEYEIDEYDGNEHIAEKHRTWS